MLCKVEICLILQLKKFHQENVYVMKHGVLSVYYPTVKMIIVKLIQKKKKNLLE